MVGIVPDRATETWRRVEPVGAGGQPCETARGQIGDPVFYRGLRGRESIHRPGGDPDTERGGKGDEPELLERDAIAVGSGFQHVNVPSFFLASGPPSGSHRYAASRPPYCRAVPSRHS